MAREETLRSRPAIRDTEGEGVHRVTEVMTKLKQVAVLETATFASSIQQNDFAMKKFDSIKPKSSQMFEHMQDEASQTSLVFKEARYNHNTVTYMSSRGPVEVSMQDSWSSHPTPIKKPSD